MAPRIRYYPPSEEFWDIPGVSYRGKTITCRLFEKMNSPMNQDKLAEFYEIEKQKGNPYPMDSVLHFAIFSKAYSLRNKSQKETEQLRNFFKQGIRNFPNTLSSEL